MRNIQFIDSENELAKLSQIQKNNFFLVLKGRRRIGKTALLTKAFPEAVYIFVWPDKSLDWIINQICTEYKLPSFKSFKDLIEYLLDKEKILILDEFQNFLNIDSSVYGEMQKLIDDRKRGSQFLKIAVAGSSYSLMNKVFNDLASPLYGRRTDEMLLEHIPARDLMRNLRMPLEEFVKLWSVFEGAPYYYERIDKKASAEENILRLILLKEAQLQEEGKALLSVEFGKDSKTYNTVLTGISEGKTKLNELASLFGNKKNEVVKYLEILRKNFRIVRKMTPLTDNPDKSREGRYEIIDNFLSFWFYFSERLRNYKEQERFDEVVRFFRSGFNAYVGKKFEKFVTMLIREEILLREAAFTAVGPQWGKRAQNSKETYEIDIVALSEKTKGILFGECKWSDNVNAKSILSELSAKTDSVQWNNETREEQFAVFAKSFKKKIVSWQGKAVYCFDLKDLEYLLKRKRR